MSNSSTHDARTVPRPSGLSLGRLLWPLEALGFWAAVVLPFLYIPLLVSGPKSDAELLTAFALIALHAVALVVGHAHRSGTAGAD